MIRDIKKEIIELLKTIEGIKGIYSYPENNPVGYPFMILTWQGNDSSVLTNQQDSVFINFKIQMVQEKLEEFKGRKEAEETAEDRAWKIETLFRENNNLGLPYVLRVLPTATTKTYDANSTRIIIETIVRVQLVVNVYNH